MKAIIPILVLAAVFVSGCSGFPGPFGDVISVQTRSVVDNPKDPIVVKDVRTFPSSPLLPDSEVVLSFIVENKDKVRPVRNIEVDLFNAPGFKNMNRELCNSGIGICKPESGVSCTSLQVEGQQSSGTRCSIDSLLPGEERLVQYRLKSPSKEQIADIKTRARMDFRVSYQFDSSTNFVIPFVNKNEALRRQREGERLNLVFDKSISSGPITLDVQPFGINYILDNFETVLLFDIKNVGSGSIVNSKIPCENGCEQSETTTQPIAGIDFEIGDDGGCDEVQGTCIDKNSACDGTRFDYRCTDPANRICCVPKGTRVSIPDDADCEFVGGTCQEQSSTCDGSYATGLCPGKKKCCIPKQQQEQPSLTITIGAQSSIENKGGLTITFPKELKVRADPGDAIADIFTIQEVDGTKVFKNKREIQIFRDKSQASLRFPVKLDDATYRNNVNSGIPFRYYEIKSTVAYTYELRNSVDVVVCSLESCS